ncbi:MAG: flagellar biosynthesis protein FlhF [Sulfuriflexus sp.]|nr:flagellar biosynthesis protein FlhF [Sulfuriflexus sp.]
MKIKRFFAKSISEAIREVRETLGSDAVILSNKEVSGGIELVAATDYDDSIFDSNNIESSIESRPATFDSADPVSTVAETPNVEWSQEPTLVEMRHELESLRGMMEDRLTGLAWGEQARRFPERTHLTRELMSLGLSPRLCQTLASEQPEQSDFSMMWRSTMGRLAHQLPVCETDFLDDGGIIALLGPTGVGKTTTIAKLAARFALRHGKQNVALITTDSYRIGAHEQLRIYGRILDVPVFIANDSEELNSVLKNVQDKRLVLIDTAGMSQRDIRLSEQFSVIQHGSPLIRSFLVLSATTQMTALDEAIKVFDAAEPEACIITKTDEATSLGPVLSVIAKHQLPIAYVADGQRVPEDIRRARAGNLVKQAEKLKLSSDELSADELMFGSQGYETHVHG